MLAIIKQVYFWINLWFCFFVYPHKEITEARQLLLNETREGQNSMTVADIMCCSQVSCNCFLRWNLSIWFICFSDVGLFSQSAQSCLSIYSLLPLKILLESQNLLINNISNNNDIKDYFKKEAQYSAKWLSWGRSKHRNIPYSLVFIYMWNVCVPSLRDLRGTTSMTILETKTQWREEPTLATRLSHAGKSFQTWVQLSKQNKSEFIKSGIWSSHSIRKEFVCVIIETWCL